MRVRFLVPATILALTVTLQACGGGGGGSNTTPSTPTPSPSPAAVGYTCPTSVSTFSTVTQAARARAVSPRKLPSGGAAQSAATNTLLAVTYAPSARALSVQDIDGKVANFSGKMVHDLTFDKIGRSVRVFSVPSTARDTVAESLRSMPGVVTVSTVQRRYPLTSSPLITNDQFFAGDGTPPLYQSASTPGQWDMHVEKLENAFGYSKQGNVNALGATAIRLAVIDTGVDITHPDLANAHIVRTQCYITDPSGTQSTGTFVTDPDGHGTNVAGIAGDQVNNGFGFAGDAGNVALMFYRVFPTPDDNCTPGSSNPNDPRCSASSSDIAAAINDAVNNGANVLSLSFGGSTCNSGADPDPVEGGAISNALQHNVIVVAASGNDAPKTIGVGAPGCDSGVIAVGATAWNDGKPNGSTSSPSSTPGEYIPSYSQFGSNNTFRSTSAWGIVAPGGDGCCGGQDSDTLHWITNIWTSTPFDTKNFGAFSCTDPFTGATNCYEEIAGTSMSTPHVGGAAALILSVNSSYGTPAKMKQLLCSTTDNIGGNQGCGRLNVYRAMAIAIGDQNPPP